MHIIRLTYERGVVHERLGLEKVIAQLVETNIEVLKGEGRC